jgi:transketolase
MTENTEVRAREDEGLEAGEDRPLTGPGAEGVETFDCRKAFADTLSELARQDDRVVAVCNDSVGSSNLGGFKQEFPDRLINVGIAEQDLVGVAAGLANGGMIPFVSAAGPFLTGRALEQIKADVAYSGFRVVLCGQSPGMAYGELGPMASLVPRITPSRTSPGCARWRACPLSCPPTQHRRRLQSGGRWSRRPGAT